MSDPFEQLIAEAEQELFEGWDFSHLDGRMIEDPQPWDYEREARRRIADCEAMLDLGTGGGEVLARLAPLPTVAIATEAYAPNAPIAARRLVPLGASVALVEGAPENWSTLATPELASPPLPFRDGAFDLVIDRHESYLAAEVFRVLRPGGTFLTQQCGGTHHAEINDLIGVPRPRYTAWGLAAAEAQLRAAGFEVMRGEESFTPTRFHDVGAIVYYLRALPWQAPGFRAASHVEALRGLHERIETGGPLAIRGHHFLVEARRPARLA